MLYRMLFLLTNVGKVWVFLGISLGKPIPSLHWLIRIYHAVIFVANIKGCRHSLFFHTNLWWFVTLTNITVCRTLEWKLGSSVILRCSEWPLELDRIPRTSRSSGSCPTPQTILHTSKWQTTIPFIPTSVKLSRVIICIEGRVNIHIMWWIIMHTVKG